MVLVIKYPLETVDIDNWKIGRAVIKLSMKN